jgi:hypothetical protein
MLNLEVTISSNGITAVSNATPRLYYTSDDTGIDTMFPLLLLQQDNERYRHGSCLIEICADNTETSVGNAMISCMNGYHYDTS